MTRLRDRLRAAAVRVFTRPRLIADFSRPGRRRHAGKTDVFERCAGHAHSRHGTEFCQPHSGFTHLGLPGGATCTPRKPARSIACFTNPDALASSINSVT